MPKKKYTRLFKQQFVDKWSYAKDESTFIEHCDRFGVPRVSGYEWLARFDADHVNGLDDKSTAPHTSPYATNQETVDLLLGARRDHPTWGPRKLKAWLVESTPWDLKLPAPSTIGDILKRGGLVPTRKRRPSTYRYPTPYTEAEAPNDVWTTDFKGHFRMRRPLLLPANARRFLQSLHPALRRVSLDKLRLSSELRERLHRIRATPGDSKRQWIAVRIGAVAREPVELERLLGAARHFARTHQAGITVGERTP
jgi:hypothetical protein